MRIQYGLIVGLLSIVLSGCASYSTPRYGNDGIYGSYDEVQRMPVVRGYSAYYPYWSLDHFYFSQFYSPFSVVNHPWDPWLFPYSAWYWNYPYSHGFFYAGSPWFYQAPWSFGGYRSWRYQQPYWRHPQHDRRQNALTNYRGRRMSAGAGHVVPVSAHQAHRLRRLEQQRSIRGSSRSVTRRSSSVPSRSSRSSTRRRAASPVSRPSSRPARTRANSRIRPPKN